MKESNKSPEVKKFLNEMSQDFFGRNRSDCIKTNICVVCGEPAIEFKDEISEKEYSISGLCQTCQDKTFG